MSTPAPPPPDWQKIKDLFEAALELPPAQRQAFIAASDTSQALREEVLSLLEQVTDDEDSFLEAPALPSLVADVAPDAGLDTGTRLGSWEIIGPLGSGGMADVLCARRADGAWEGEAAVKLLKRGMDSEAVLRRFALEQQALARLNHPHIARLLDAGRGPEGQPYFVMEKISGLAIDKACEGQPLERRLEWFLQLADAVAFAHRHLLVHRDLKPSNVMVDERGQVKLLDFGIAKALDPFEADALAAGATQAGQRPFTPYYASPEQVRGEPVGTGTDLYSLGVLLYVMLTGLRPYGRHASTAQEAVRSVLEEEPTRPSSLSPAQVTDPLWMATRKRLRGDLDNILLKALEKSTERRYPSVEAMASDVKAFLGGFPVSARPASAAYLASRFVRRHPVGTALASLATVAILASSGVALWQAQRAERNLANVGAITRDVVLHYSDALTALSGGVALKERLLQELIAQLGRLEAEIGDDPVWLRDLATAHARLAEVQGNDTGVSVNKLSDASVNARRAIELGDQAWPALRGDPRLAATLAQALQMQAQTSRAQGKPQDALAPLERALALIDEALPQAIGGERRKLRLQKAGAWLVLAQIHDQQSIPHLDQPDKALDWYARSEQELLALDSEQADLASGDMLGTLYGGRALTHGRQSRLDEAAEDAGRAMRFRQRAVDQEPGNVIYRDGLITEATNHGVILLRANQPQAALASTRVAWQHVQVLARENGPGNQWLSKQPRVAQHHGRALLANGLDQEALPVVEEALSFWLERFKQKPSPQTERMNAWMSLQKAKALWGSGQQTQALLLARQHWQTLERLAAAPKARDALLNLGEAGLFLAKADSAQQALWLARALSAYQRAADLAPLSGDHLAQFQLAQSAATQARKPVEASALRRAAQPPGKV